MIGVSLKCILLLHIISNLIRIVDPAIHSTGNCTILAGQLRGKVFGSV